MNKGIVILVVLLFFYLPGSAQASKSKRKIDPVFISLINQQQKDSVAANKNYPRTKGKAIEADISKNEFIEKKYECIVYTKYAKALRDKGIVINSELPTFVTAIATLKQIQQMSLMSEVTYILAPSTNILH